MNAPFVTLAASRRAETRVQGSRFIAKAVPARGEPEARAAVEAARSEFPDATHHCSASRIAGAAGVEERAHDAGEPAGTAGPPILQAIRSAGLTNVAVVVTRWFGGTKLGKGGLARAYRAAAAAALEGAARVEEVPRVERRLTAPLSRDGEIRNLLARHGGVILEAAYDGGESARFTVRLPSASEAALRRELDDLTRGAASLEETAPGRGGGVAG